MASSALGLRASRNLFMSSITRATTGTAVSRNMACQLAIRGNRSASHRASQRESSPTAPSVQRQMQHLGTIDPSVMQMMLPGTMITPPLSTWPRDRKSFLAFSLDVFKSWIRGKFQIIMMSISSKPGIFKARRFKLNNAQLLLTAKNMHREMAEAIASGNKDALRKLCVQTLATPLSTTISHRPKGVRYEWELVKYKGWRNPKIVSQVLAPVAPTQGAPLVRQVVVRIKSRQRKTTLERTRDGEWAVKEGGQKEQDLVEHIVLVSVVKPGTWEASEWRILGSVQPTSYEDWKLEMDTLKAVEMEELKKFKL